MRKQSFFVREWIVPDWALCTLINADSSALEEEDIAKIDAFLAKCAEYANGRRWHLGSVAEYGFRTCNDIDRLGADCSIIDQVIYTEAAQ